MSGGLILLTGPLFVLLMLFVSVALGQRVLRLLGATASATRGERLIITATIGLGLVQFLPFLLSLADQLSVTSLRISVAVIAVALLPDARKIPGGARSAWRERSMPDVWGWAWLAILAVPMALAFFIAVAPAFDIDGISYHLGAPKQWLQDGSLTYLPTYVVTNGTMGAEMLFAIGLAFVGDGGAKLLHLAAVLLGAAGLVLSGRRLGSPMAGRVAATLYLLGPVGAYELAGWAYVEGLASLAIIATVIAWLIWYQHGDRSWLLTAALLSGISVSFKLTSVVFPAALAALTILVVRHRNRDQEAGTDRVDAGLGPNPLAFTAGLAALAAVGVVPWLARSWVIAGNPFYPILARWIPSRDFPAEMSVDFEQYNRYFLWGGRWGNEISIDTRRLIIAGVAVVILAVGAIAFRMRKDPIERSVIVVLAGTLLVQTVAAGLYSRYWIPIAAVAQLPIVAFVVSRVERRVAQIGLIVATVLLALVAIRPVVTSDPSQLVAASFDSGERTAFLSDTVGLYPLYVTATNELPDDSGVLMTYFCGGFYIDGQTFCAEFLQNSLRFTTWEEFTADIESLGITHVIAPTALATGGPRPSDGNFSGSAGFVTRDGMYTNVSRLLAERGRLLDTALDQGLYELAGES